MMNKADGRELPMLENVTGRFFFRRKVCRWEIAWVKKLIINGELKFTIDYLYPSNGKHLFDSLNAAKKEVDKTFKWFIN